MSNEKTSCTADRGSFKSSSSSSPVDLTGGAATIPFDSSTLSCIKSSCGRSEIYAPVDECIGSKLPTESGSLLSLVSDAQYLSRVTDIIERVAQAADLPSAFLLFARGARQLGAECATFISFVRGRTEESSSRFMLACDPEWCRQYLAAGHIAHDPWLAYAAHAAEPILASELVLRSERSREVVELAQTSGFASAALIPVHAGDSVRVGLLCLGSRRPHYFEPTAFRRLRIGARALAAELHDWWLTRIRDELLQTAKLSAADLDLLGYEMRGHGSKRIAALLGVSADSIDSRFQRINMRLGVANRRAAVQLALECGVPLRSPAD